MTDGAMFYPLFKILQEKEVYYPKINNADIYLDFIEYDSAYSNSCIHLRR